CTTSKMTTANLVEGNATEINNSKLNLKDQILLEEFYKNNKLKEPTKDVIVAVIDTRIDINHEELKGRIWTNKNEIPNNNVDDDTNGYVDDVNGWNFIGTKSGNYTVWTNFEYIRIIRKWDSVFKNKKQDEISNSDKENYSQYQTAIKYYSYYRNYYSEYLKSIQYSEKIFPLAKDTLKHFFPKEDYNFVKLDSLYKIYGKNKNYSQMRDNEDKELDALIYDMMANIESNIKSVTELTDKKNELDSILNKNLNLDYNERIFIGDNPELLEKGYGNNTISKNIPGIKQIKNHSTKVAGLIAANRENNIGIKGFSDHIKIMPLSVSCSGDEHDKDIAMAIYYAVDNGAKVINMSFSKSFSLNKLWVEEAIKYAQSKNVLLVHGAGNGKINLDSFANYPNDYDYLKKSEIASNFINVGSVTSKLDTTFVSSFSNYGKENVDLFAPGDQIYTPIQDNKYAFDSGTSLSAPMVSGTAALIWLYYPSLTVQEVKKIILDSGTSYDIEVLIPGGEGKKAPFKDLSKSGKVLNVLNAMKMAAEMSKKGNNYNK
ncbi:S8 family serine peptidase, partial [Flavobacterium sp.]|uniref:S8 family serine peptidase n=1 Tax=Flavobacterium sp. TaxID=239 RepID=UPI00391D98A4